MTYKPDYAAFGEHVLRADWMLEEMVRRAENAKIEAEATAPFDPNSHDGTHYKDSFRVASDTHGGVQKDRAEARLVNDDSAAIYIEYGTRDTPRHRTLGRATDAMRD